MSTRKLKSELLHLEGLMRCIRMKNVYEYLGDGKNWQKRIDEIKSILITRKESQNNKSYRVRIMSTVKS